MQFFLPWNPRFTLTLKVQNLFAKYSPVSVKLTVEPVILIFWCPYVGPYVGQI